MVTAAGAADGVAAAGTAGGGAAAAGCGGRRLQGPVGRGPLGAPNVRGLPAAGAAWCPRAWPKRPLAPPPSAQPCLIDYPAIRKRQSQLPDITIETGLSAAAAAIEASAPPVPLLHASCPGKIGGKAGGHQDDAVEYGFGKGNHWTIIDRRANDNRFVAEEESVFSDSDISDPNWERDLPSPIQDNPCLHPR